MPTRLKRKKGFRLYGRSRQSLVRILGARYAGLLDDVVFWIESVTLKQVNRYCEFTALKGHAYLAGSSRTWALDPVGPLLRKHRLVAGIRPLDSGWVLVLHTETKGYTKTYQPDMPGIVVCKLTIS